MSDDLMEKVAKAISDSVQTDDDHDFAITVRAAIAAIEASGTHRVVPVEPDKAMLAAVRWDYDDATSGYAAMLAAAPKVAE